MKRKSTYYTACTARYMMILENVKGANQMITSLADTVTLNNSTKIPGMGLGVFQIPDEETAKVVE